MDSMKRFDPAENVMFLTFANRRISGAMMDHLRRTDPASRCIRGRIKLKQSTAASFYAEYGHEPTDDEIQQKLQVDDRAFSRIKDATFPHHHSLSATAIDNGDQRLSVGNTITDSSLPVGSLLEVEDIIQCVARRWGVTKAIIFRLYFLENESMRSLGSCVGFSESRVSQLISETIQRLRDKFKYEGVDA
jgi:RNA polymerase sigma factor for flagellar operon FliA